MKNNRSVLMILISIFLSTQAIAQTTNDMDRNLILTEGVSEVTGYNDSVKISVAVITNGRNLEDVSSDNAGKTRKVIESIGDMNIKNLKLKTSGYQVIPQRDYQVKPPVIKGYEVRNSVEIKLEEFASEELSLHVSKITGQALRNGANSIQSVQSYIKDKNPYEREALTTAVKEAKDRAEIMAKAAGVKIKRIVSISTQPVSSPQRPIALRSFDSKMETRAVSPPIEIGESSIRVHVNMAFEIE